MSTTLRMPAEVEDRYKRLAGETGRSASYFYNQALSGSIDELEYTYGLLKQVEDYRAGRLKTYTLDEVRSYLDGLDD